MDPAQEERFRIFERSMYFLNLRVDSSLSIKLQNARMLESGFDAEELELFRQWQTARREQRAQEEAYLRRKWPLEEIGELLDGLGNKVKPAELANMEKDFLNRQKPTVRLGHCNGYNVQLRINVRLDVTYKSMEAKVGCRRGLGNDYHESWGPGDKREKVPLLLSLYRNEEDEQPTARGPWLSEDTQDSSGSEDEEKPAPKPSVTKFEAETDVEYVTRLLRVAEIEARQKSGGLGGTASSDKKREYYAYEGRNRLKTFLPLGPLQIQSFAEAETDYPCWTKTPWYLVVNLYDKRPWIVLNPDMRSEYGGADTYLPPGQRLAGFCERTNLRSHARLDFSTPAETKMDPAPPHRRRGQREAQALPKDFWRALFAAGGTFNREFRAAPFFQDNSFSIGYAVWDAEEERVHRQFDTLKVADPKTRRLLIDDFVYSFQLPESPPNPQWNHVDETVLHDFQRATHRRELTV